jgi:hypothetical protein
MIAAVLLATLTAVASADTVRIGNARITLGFDRANGALVEFVDRASGHSFVQAQSEIWQLDRFEANGAALAPKDAGRFTVRMLSAPRRGAELTWSEFAGAPRFRVVATITLRGDSALSDWRIALEDMGDVRVEQVHFPRIGNMGELPNEELVIPRWMGTLARQPKSVLYDSAGSARRLQFDYPSAAHVVLARRRRLLRGRRRHTRLP